MIIDQIRRHKVLLTIDHKNYNFGEKNNSQAMKILTKTRKLLNVALKLRLVELNYNSKCDWLIELSDNKLFNNNLVSELVDNRSFFSQSQSQNL